MAVIQIRDDQIKNYTNKSALWQETAPQRVVNFTNVNGGLCYSAALLAYMVVLKCITAIG